MTFTELPRELRGMCAERILGQTVRGMTNATGIAEVDLVNIYSIGEMVVEAVHSAVDQWMDESEIVYTEVGEAWKLPEADEDDAEEAAEVPAEETAEAPAEETPAE